MDKQLRVFIADDHSTVREGLRSLISDQPDMEVCGDAADGLAAVQNAGEKLPDVAVFDISMPGIGGVEATQRLKQSHPDIKVLLLTVHEDRSYLKQSLSAGASGYVLKRAAANELIGAIRAVAAGGTYVDPAMASRLFGNKRAHDVVDALAHTTLSEREEEVASLIAQGYSNKEIASRLAISVKTVETYKARSFEKLGLRSRVELVRYALRQGWLKDA